MIIAKNNKGECYRDGTEITEEEYQSIMAIIQNRPIAPDGYIYRLTETLEWDMLEISVEDDEVAPEEALAELMEVLQ